MKSLNSLSNHVGSLPTKAVQTFAHSSGFSAFGFRERHSASVKTKLRVGNPSSLATSGSNPDASLTFSVNDLKSPLRFEFNNIAVSNRFTSPRVNNNYLVISKNQFGFNPDQIGDTAQHNTAQQFNNPLTWILKDKETVGSEKNQQQKRSTSPDEITFGAKGFRHVPIIAGERQ